MWLGLFGRKGLLHTRWKEAVAVSVTSGFVAFLFYLILRGLAPHLGVTPGRWMIFPAVLVVLWLYHDMMFLRRRR